MTIRLLLLMSILSLMACKDNQTLTTQEEEQYLQLGDSISNIMQKELLKNVKQAIQQRGIDYAVDFCNVKAIPLTDSLSMFNNVKIQRLSDKNRNPNNAIHSQADKMAWEKLSTDKTDFIEVESSKDIFYYKPIILALPTCLKCHGSSSDIAGTTQEMIDLKYPADKAVGYTMGDLRGMWKIQLK
ncbi:Tll0287-like domain-containing protein [Membranihabitans marinus]|uniref:Tll0287-like domain-containing protein n=1 Tax=Membranihabitans marinus TaxID=1227546 RepID=UPI001F1D2AD0|nr:DUF3365 domain-containing protein [Membranihabitans marinus]